jgi:hypothetical protein
MTSQEIKNYTASLTDSRLIECAEKAHADLHAAEPQSEWQASCFAALYVFCEEMGKRGLKAPERQRSANAGGEGVV